VTRFLCTFINNSEVELSRNVYYISPKSFFNNHLHIQFPFGCELFRKPEALKNIILINSFAVIVPYITLKVTSLDPSLFYEGWNFNSGNYLFTTDTK